MFSLIYRRKLYVGAAVLFSLGAVVAIAGATHSWGGYHWARSQNPFTVVLGDNVSSLWDQHLKTASGDWNNSSVLDTAIIPGTKNPKTCKATSGRVEVCNAKYGRNGWLGLASIGIQGSHIMQGVVKMNDTYFNTAFYNNPAWKNLVMCQEIGHTLGLDHQDENFNNAPLGTCMDYSADPAPNQHPNQHDYDMLETIYAHLDATSTRTSVVSRLRQDVDHDDPSSWGSEIRRSGDGRVSLYMRDFGRGEKVFTYVFWAERQNVSGLVR